MLALQGLSSLSALELASQAAGLARPTLPCIGEGRLREAEVPWATWKFAKRGHSETNTQSGRCNLRRLLQYFNIGLWLFCIHRTSAFGLGTQSTKHTKLSLSFVEDSYNVSV